jgi:hypothetical protein
LDHAGAEIVASDGRHLRVLDVLPTDDDSDQYTGLLRVEPV